VVEAAGVATGDVSVAVEQPKPMEVGVSSEAKSEKEPETGTGKRYLALKLAFSLPTSTYATMLIRELTKSPTDIHYQSSLN